MHIKFQAFLGLRALGHTVCDKTKIETHLSPSLSFIKKDGKEYRESYYQ